MWGSIAQGGSGLIWGAGNVSQIPVTVPVPWAFPLVFEKLQMVMTADIADVTIGTMYMRYQQSGYMVLGTRIA